MTTQTFSTTQNKATVLFPALWQLILTEFRRLLREPMFAVGTIGFPLLFFVLFGLPNINNTLPDGTPLGGYIAINFAANALVSLALFSFGANIASERQNAWLRLLRASPMPTFLYFIAKLIAALVFSALAVAIQYLFAHLIGGVTLSALTLLITLAKLLLGMIPLIMMGLAIGFLSSPVAASMMANIIGLVLAFGSGLFMPLHLLPKFVQQIAPFLPVYHLGEVARSALVPTTYAELHHWLILFGFGILFGALALWGWKNDEYRT